jgi:hypothetical protein
MKQQPKLKENEEEKKVDYSEKELEEEKLPERDEDGIEIIP